MRGQFWEFGDGFENSLDRQECLSYGVSLRIDSIREHNLFLEGNLLEIFAFRKFAEQLILKQWN
jgi:hypothetical protein